MQPCERVFSISTLKKKWSQNGSTLELFWKTVPLFKCGAVFLLYYHVWDNNVTKAVPKLGSCWGPFRLHYFRSVHSILFARAMLKLYFCGLSCMILYSNISNLEVIIYYQQTELNVYPTRHGAVCDLMRHLTINCSKTVSNIAVYVSIRIM